MKINLSDYPDLDDYLSDLDYTWIDTTFRTWDKVSVRLVFNITPEAVVWLRDCGTVKILPPDLVGFWMSNRVSKDDYCGIQFSEITELTKVERKERQVTTTEVYYEPVNQ